MVYGHASVDEGHRRIKKKKLHVLHSFHDMVQKAMLHSGLNEWH